MIEPQHPTPFGSQTGDLSGGQRDGQGGAGGAASNASQAGPLDSMQAVGARLAQLRQAKAWSIDDVSARLKVSPTKLLALEAGDISHMPDRTFAAGIVRSYAKILGADPAPFTQVFRRDGTPVEHNLKVPATGGAGLPRQRVSVPLGNSSGRKRSWLWGIAAIVVVIAALATWHTGGDSAAWLARLKSSTGASTSTSGDTVAASGVATPDEAAAANTGEGSSLPEVAAAPGEQPMPRPLGTNALPASTSAIADLQGTNLAAATAAKSASAAPAAAAASAPGVAGTGSSAVELKVKEDSWFSVRGKDGKEVFSGLVHAGSTQRVQGEPPFKVTVGNAKGVESISLDNEPVDTKKYVSARGNVARFSLP